MNHWFALPFLLATSALCRSADAPAPADTPAPAITPGGPATPSTTPPPSAAPIPAPAVPQPATPPPTLVPPAATRVNEPPTAAVAPPANPVSGPSVTVKQSNVNVRGQPRINSDVVTRLNRGDQVIVLEEIKLPNPKTDEPAGWTKVALPPTAFVWVHSSFVDPATKTVKVNRLNVRNGPGENFSVLGRIEKGTAIKEIETKGLWIKIAPPSGTYGYVASHLLNHPTKGTEVAAAKPVKPAGPATPAVEPASVVANTVTVATNTPSDLAATTAPALPAAEVTPGTTNSPNAALEEAEAERAEKRIVTREGIVRRSVSIQAPTYFVLENKENRKTINYLFSPGNKALLRDYENQRILVTGEEMLDERWPNTPVITVDKLRAMP